MTAVTIVVARATNGAIGKDGSLPWHLPADLKRFKALTMGSAMLMGRKTFEALPGLLPGRRHIVLTRNPGWKADGAQVAHDAKEALALAASEPVTVIGGAEVVAALLDRAQRVELTEVHALPEADTFLPPFDPDRWRESWREDHPSEAGRPAFSFVTLFRAGR